MGDTGIDTNSCFFHDPLVTIPYDTVNMNHRKIVQYRTLGDSVDVVGGHGSHVVCWDLVWVVSVLGFLLIIFCYFFSVW